mmetsp:Transcript_40908/g.65867  ORF Transcript_40908/g.65867 Transcript_40908/m.65867 type:complete len:166 (+) Transcript_40908:1-498(+)
MFALLNGVKTCAKHASDNTTCLQFFYHNGVTPQPAWRGVAYSHVPFASTVGTALGHTDAAGTNRVQFSILHSRVCALSLSHSIHHVYALPAFDNQSHSCLAQTLKMSNTKDSACKTPPPSSSPVMTRCVCVCRPLPLVLEGRKGRRKGWWRIKSAPVEARTRLKI